MKTLSAIPALALALALALATGAAFAADPPPPAATDAITAACKGDVERLCAGVQPGEGRIVACFKEHRREVSAECRKQLAARKAAGKG